jgi:hypothetical protein
MPQDKVREVTRPHLVKPAWAMAEPLEKKLLTEPSVVEDRGGHKPAL